MRRPSSLRGRLTVVFAAVAALLVAASGVGTAVLIEHAFWGPLDGALLEEAETLASVLDVGPGEDLPKLVARIGAEKAPGPGKFILVRGADGVVLASAGRVPASMTGSLSADPANRAETAWSDAAPYRVAFARSAGGAVCTIGLPVRGAVGLLRRARWMIGAAACVLVATFSALAWAITSRATAELDRVAAELETVEAGSLDKRLSPRETTEVGRLVAVLNRLLERLERAMESLRRFTADASHELRTPIAALRAHLELALGQTGSPAPASLVDALEQGERLGRLAEDLLTLSSVESASFERDEEIVSVDRLLREMLAELEPMIGEQGRTLVEALEADVHVRGVPSLLRRLFLNLVDNALRHTPPSASLHVSLRTEDGRAVLEVRDEGPGLDREEAAAVFQRFRRGKSGANGSGLGLAICREITRRHRGEVRLDSELGRGTTARVELPLAGVSRPSFTLSSSYSR
jgi:signal transduction histidine kinase